MTAIHESLNTWTDETILLPAYDGILLNSKAINLELAIKQALHRRDTVQLLKELTKSLCEEKIKGFEKG